MSNNTTIVDFVKHHQNRAPDARIENVIDFGHIHYDYNIISAANGRVWRIVKPDLTFFGEADVPGWVNPYPNEGYNPILAYKSADTAQRMLERLFRSARHAQNKKVRQPNDSLV